jgi:transcriptional regulator with XRE-family HTH domain
LRAKRGLSIREFAAKAGVSLGLISQIERNIANPSVKTLTKIRLALDVSFSQLFATEGAEASIVTSYVVRRRARPHLEYEEKFTKEILSPPGESNLEFMILNIPPGRGWDKTPLSYAAEKAGLVLEGTLLLCVDDAQTVLEEGDSFQFDGMRPHSLQNKGAGHCRALWIISHNSMRPPI